MKEPTKLIIETVLIAVVSFFCIYLLYTAKIGSNGNIYEELGSVANSQTTSNINTDTTKDQFNNTTENAETEITYIGGILEVGSEVNYKELFSVQYNGASYVGTEEIVFSLYLVDIYNQNSESVLSVYTTEGIQGAEELSAPFIYDFEKNILYVSTSGTYEMEIRLCDENGSIMYYRVTIPVIQKIGG